MSNKDEFYNNLIKKKLHPMFWNSNLVFDETAEQQLLNIANKFFDSLDLDAKILDIVLIGSIANYNWHSDSDLDAHIILDFKDISDDEELVSNYLELERKQWNNEHDIEIYDFPVELSFNDFSETINSAGMYSLLNSVWIRIPERENITKNTIEESKDMFIVIKDSINEIETKYKNNEISPLETYQQSKRVWTLIKKLRNKFIEKEGEFGPKNLTFKKLRNEGYIDTITSIKTETFDKIFSI